MAVGFVLLGVEILTGPNSFQTFPQHRSVRPGRVNRIWFLQVWRVCRTSCDPEFRSWETLTHEVQCYVMQVSIWHLCHIFLRTTRSNADWTNSSPGDLCWPSTILIHLASPQTFKPYVLNSRRDHCPSRMEQERWPAVHLFQLFWPLGPISAIVSFLSWESCCRHFIHTLDQWPKGGDGPQGFKFNGKCSTSQRGSEETFPCRPRCMMLFMPLLGSHSWRRPCRHTSYVIRRLS